MSNVLEFHNEAMGFVSRATLTSEMQPVGELSKLELFQQALELELKAIQALEQQEFHALTYSVVHRSAASVALESGDFALAEQLASKAIARGADPAIIQDLRIIARRAFTNQDLQQHGIQLRNNDIQMSLDGPAIIDDGMIPWSEWHGRIRTAIGLMNKIVKDAVFKPPIFISRPRAGSFAVSIRLGSPVIDSDAFDGMDPVPAYIDKFMNSMNAVNQLDLQFLESRFQNPEDRKSFLNTARRIAPDGKRVENVNFTQTKPTNETRTVAITKTTSTLPKPTELNVEDPRDNETVTGRLLFADGRDEDKSQIRVVAANGDIRIDVPEDKNIYGIVDEMWNCDVEVVALKSRGKLELRDIKLLQPNMFTLSH